MTSLYVSSASYFLPSSPRNSHTTSRGCSSRSRCSRFPCFFSSRSKLAGRYAREVSSKCSLRGKIYDGYYCREVSCCAKRAPRFVSAREEDKGGIIRACGRYFAVSFLHGQCYPFCFHGRYQSYIFIVGVPALISNVVIIVAFARARDCCDPMRLGHTFSNYLVLQLSRSSTAHLHHLRRADFISERLSSRKGFVSEDITP